VAILSVSPTRMELSRLKKQLQLSERGHKLLKDKQDELMRQFLDIIRDTRALRDELERKFSAVRHAALLAKAPFPEKAVLESSLSSAPQIDFSMKTKNQMGVYVPVMTFSERQPEASLSLSPALQASKEKMAELLPDLLKLAQMEKKCVILAAEIEKTRRRVNALEYMTIPQLRETIRFIVMRLEDAERDRITRIIKMQDFDIAPEQ
jgi:V/A-type H+-transporting ATPase subunit D